MQERVAKTQSNGSIEARGVNNPSREPIQTGTTGDIDLGKVRHLLASRRQDAETISKPETGAEINSPDVSKVVLLTGGAGFIGHHTVEHILKNTDWGILIVDRLSYAGNLNKLTDIEIWEKEKARVRFVFHDFRAAFSEETTKQIGDVDYIIHMGAETHVDRSLSDPRLFVDSNVMGAVNVLELARTLQPEKVIYVSTDEVYGPAHGEHLHKEGDPHKPSNPYAASKAAGEDFARAYHSSFSVPAIITSTMNNFGERQHPEKFFPLAAKAVLEGQELPIHCRMEGDEVVEISSRHWLHPRNHADGLLFLLNNGIPGEAYNIVGEEASVSKIAEMVSKALKKPLRVRYVDFHSSRPGHDLRYALDGTKMQELGWKPPLTLKQSLTKASEWSKERKDDWL